MASIIKSLRKGKLASNSADTNGKNVSNKYLLLQVICLSYQQLLKTMMEIYYNLATQIFLFTAFECFLLIQSSDKTYR